MAEAAAPKKNSSSKKKETAKATTPQPSVALVKAPSMSDLTVELGTDQNLPFSTPYHEFSKQGKSEKDRLYEIIRGWDEEDGPTIPQLVAMRRMDGQARALYRLITLPIRSALATSDFIAAEGGEKEAEFIRQVFTLPPSQGGMTVTFSHVMAQLLSAVFDGFSVFEKVIWMPPKGPLKGKYTLKKLAYRPSETVTFITDQNGGFAGVRQRAFINGREIDKHIDRENCFYYAAQEEERKFYGVSFFQSAFYHYDKKMKMYFIAHLAAQRAAVGTRVGTVPANATQADRAAFAQSLSNLAVAQYMMYPEGFEVEVLKEGGSFDFLNYINHHNSQMSKSVLATFFDEDKGGGSADSKMINFASPGDDMFILMLRSIMDDIATAINHYVIPQLIDLNFNSGKYPTFTWGKLTEDQKAAVSQIFEKLAAAGDSLNITPEFMREIEVQMADQLSLQIDYEAVDKREAEEKAAADAQLAAAGIGPDGMPLPTGDPSLQGADQELSEFEDAAMSLSNGTLELSGERKVRTTEGAKKYGEPIGSTITDDVNTKTSDQRVTVERLISLYRQLKQAKKIGDDNAAANALSRLNQALAKMPKTSGNKDALSRINRLLNS